MRYYIGITIGPIFDTILEAGSPGTLWFGSTLFSDITRRLYIALTTSYPEDNNNRYYSPAFDNADKDGLKDGIGKYHDRIIFSVMANNPETIKTKLDEIIKKTKKETLNIFNLTYKDDNERCEHESFIEEYLQINYCISEENNDVNENCILRISPYLDALELMKTFPNTNKNNPISQVMTKKYKGQSANDGVKHTQLFKTAFSDESNNQFIKDGTFRTIEDIALGENTDITHKYQKYYAVVNADADGMGDFLKSINDDQTSVFSGKCLEYVKEASKLIGDFGGMTIYAGGDDLLFLAPVKSGKKTLFELCYDISDTFKKIINKVKDFEGKKIPTISYGISIHYVRYPLYEALNDSRSLLRKAKKYNGKNCMAINLEKHSGQSASIVVGNEKFTFNDSDYNSILNAYLKLSEDYLNRSETNSPDIYLKNIGSKIELHYGMLKTINDSLTTKRNNSEHIRTSWDNLFDNEGQQGATEYITRLNELFYESINKYTRIGTFDVFDDKHGDKYLNTLLAIIRISKFFVEEPGSKD